MQPPGDVNGHDRAPDAQSSTSDASALSPADPAPTYRDTPTLATSASESPTHMAAPHDSEAGRLRAKPGDRVGHFSVLSLIAHGGMGEVWEATDLKLRRVVALKLIRPDKLTADLMHRFETESRAQARLHHDGIAQIFQAETDVAQPFIAMELIRGARRLNVYAREERLTVAARVALLAKVVDAVAHAHQQGVLHLDLKPSNILVRADGQPKILDFGGGRILEYPVDPVKDVAIVTPAYMSPEQSWLDLTRVDHRSDLYTVGVIAFELFAGELPYEVSGKTFSQVRDALCGPTHPKRLLTLTGSARREVGTVIRKAIEKRPDDRFQSATEFSLTLRQLLGGHGGQTTWTTGVQRWLRQDDHVAWSGRTLGLVSWLIAALCAWFIVIAVAMPAIREVVIPGVRPREFVVHEGTWIVSLVAVGFVARLAARGSRAFIWLVTIVAAGLNVFTFSVASGRYAYEGAGSVSDPVTRAIVFTILSAISMMSLGICALMLLSHYARSSWAVVPRLSPKP